MFAGHLRQGGVQSCGCLQRDSRFKHGHSDTKLYWVWAAMIQRCTNPKNEHYADYGGRGIFVTERWLLFENFFADMGEPADGMTLEREDNDGPYSPDNCSWRSRVHQNQNTRRNREITVGGKTECLQHWLRHFGICSDTFYKRVASGMTEEEALTRPKKTWKAAGS